MINVLIRTSYRPEQFKRCIESVQRQTYSPIRVIVGYDNKESLDYIPEGIEKVEMKPEEGRFFYNKYCNQLKDLVTEGHFFFLDDDDYLTHPKVLERVSEYLFDGALIVQFLRGGTAKQKDMLQDARKIEVGHVGLPCLILHYSYKNVADLEGEKDFDDYKWIKKVSEKVETRFVKIPVVSAEKRSWGKIGSG